MQINKITLTNNRNSRSNADRSKNDISNNGYSNMSKSYLTSTNLVGNTSRSNKMDKTSFGIEPLSTSVILAIYWSIVLGAPTLLIAGIYAADKISNAVDARRYRRKKEMKAEVLQDIARMESKNPQMSGKAITKAWAKKLERVSIKQSGDGDEVGLNKVIGFDNLKYNLAKKVLMPLCDVMDGKNAHSQVPNGICLFGPAGTGKSHTAKSLGEHYEALGGNFEEMEFSGNDEKDIKQLNNLFKAAEEKYNKSGKKEYTIILVDDLEKKLSPHTTGALISLSNNCKDKGAIFVSTSNDLKLISPYLLRDGRTDLRVPVGEVEDFDVADMINYSMAKNGMAHDTIDYADILEALKEKSLKYKPKEIEKALTTAYADYKDFGGYLKTEDIKKALKNAKIEFNETEAKLYSDNIAYAKQIGGVNEY